MRFFMTLRIDRNPPLKEISGGEMKYYIFSCCFITIQATLLNSDVR